MKAPISRNLHIFQTKIEKSQTQGFGVKIFVKEYCVYIYKSIEREVHASLFTDKRSFCKINVYKQN